MNKLVITGPNKAEFIETDIPRINESQILVKTICTAISTGTEIRVYRGISIDATNKLMFPKISWDYPVENGYSTVGEIVEIGNEINDYKIGQRVFTGETHKQYAACNPVDVYKIPDDISNENAAMLNILQVGHLALRSANPSFGENVINSFIKLKNMEIEEFNKVETFDKTRKITDWEKKNTLDC